MKTSPLLPKHHGTRTGYGYGCRCTSCREANLEYQQDRARALRANETDRRHGTATGYTEGCRCKDCRYAFRAWAAGVLQSGDFTHGTTDGYRIGCRCDDCRAAKLDSNAASMARKREDGHATLAEVRIFANTLGLPVPKGGARLEALVNRYNRLHPDRTYVP